MNEEICEVCEKEFTSEEWEKRHYIYEDDDSRPVHEDCCPACKDD